MIRPNNELKTIQMILLAVLVVSVMRNSLLGKCLHCRNLWHIYPKEHSFKIDICLNIEKIMKI